MRLLTFFVRYIKVMIGYLTSYIKESPFVLFQPYAHSKTLFWTDMINSGGIYNGNE
jgi:hypothetical protein